jgi:hypothetical protein
MTAYYGFNGLSYFLQQGDRTKQLKQKLDISTYAHNNDLIKIEKPISIEIIEILGIPFTYSVHMRPYRSFGIPCTNLKYNIIDVDSKTMVQQMLLIWDQLVTTIDILYNDQLAPIYPVDINFFNVCYHQEKQKFFLAGDLHFHEHRRYAIDATVFDLWLKQEEEITVDLKTYISEVITTQCKTLHLTQ